MDGDHTLERCSEVTEEVLRTVFHQLYTQRVMLEGMLLKPNMVLPGLTCPKQETVDEVADATVKCLLRAVPAAVPGIAFLSGGQPAELASARLNAMNAQIQVATALGAGVFVCPGHPATGVGDLAWRGSQRGRRTTSSVASSQVQPGRAPRRIHCRHGDRGAHDRTIPPIPTRGIAKKEGYRMATRMPSSPRLPKRSRGRAQVRRTI